MEWELLPGLERRFFSGNALDRADVDLEPIVVPPAPRKRPAIVGALASAQAARAWLDLQSAHVQRCGRVMEAAVAACDYAETKRRRSMKLRVLRNAEHRIDATTGTSTDRGSRAVSVPHLAAFNTSEWSLRILGADSHDGEQAIELVEWNVRSLFERKGFDAEVLAEHSTTTWYRRRRPGERVSVVARVPTGHFRLYQALATAIANLDVLSVTGPLSSDGARFDTEKTKARVARTLIDFLCRFIEEEPPSGIELAAIAVATGIDEPTLNGAIQVDVRGVKWRKKKSAVDGEVGLLLQNEAKRDSSRTRGGRGGKKRPGVRRKSSHS